MRLFGEVHAAGNKNYKTTLCITSIPSRAVKNYGGGGWSSFLLHYWGGTCAVKKRM